MTCLNVQSARLLLCKWGQPFEPSGMQSQTAYVVKKNKKVQAMQRKGEVSWDGFNPLFLSLCYLRLTDLEHLGQESWGCDGKHHDSYRTFKLIFMHHFTWCYLMLPRPSVEAAPPQLRLSELSLRELAASGSREEPGWVKSCRTGPKY